MAPRRSSGVRPLADFLAELADRSDMRYGRRRLETTQALRDALRVALGSDAPNRCRPGGYVGVVAIIDCRSSSTAQIVAMHLPQILDELHRRVSHTDVKELRLAIDQERWA